MSAIKRSVQLLDLLSRKGSLGVRALSQQAGIPVGSVHRILQDLQAEKVVEQERSGDWTLSYRLLQITDQHLERIEIPRIVRPYCERIAELTQETVNIILRSGLGAVCVDKVRSNEYMQLDMGVGFRGPLHCGGAGKAILAFSTAEEQQSVLDGALEALTPNTITDPKKLTAEIERIRARGYSIDNQEVVIGVWCVSMPILDGSGRAAGAISITGPSPKKPGPEVEPMVAMLNEVCSHVSRRLGFSGAWLR